MSRRQKIIDASKERINALEERLAGTLQPVTPPGEVVQRLGSRVRELKPRMIARRLSNWEFVLIVIGSVMSVAMMILTLVRALFYFFGRGKRRMA